MTIINHAKSVHNKKEEMDSAAYSIVGRTGYSIVSLTAYSIVGLTGA